MTALRERLLEVFEIEYREHVEAMRSILAAADARAPGAAELNEATRRAHTLKGAARAVGLSDVEGLAHGLESLFAKAKANEVALDGEMRRRVTDTLDEIEDAVTAAAELPVARNAALPYADEIVAPEDAAGAKSASVRVGALQLNDLFKSAGELQADLVRQRATAAEVRMMSTDIAVLERQWTRARRNEGSGPSSGEIDASIRKLNKHARSIAATQTASTASLRGNLQRLDARVRSAGMLSAESVFGGFRKMVRDLALAEGKEVAVRIEGLDCEADRLVLQRIKDPVMHLLRNAVSHGIEAAGERRARGKPTEGRVRLAISAERGRLSIVVEDDGRGVDFAATAARAVERGLMAPDSVEGADHNALARLLFEPGFSTAPEVTRISGRGVGLSVAREAVNDLDGAITLHSAPDTGTRIEISVPLSILARRLLLVSFRDQIVAIPCDAVVKALRVPLVDIVSVEGRPALRHDGAPVPLRSLGELLDLADATVASDASGSVVVILRGPNGKVGLAVEGFGGVGEFAVRPLDPATGGQRIWSGITLTPDGAPCLVLGSGALAELGTHAATPVVFDQRQRPVDATPRVLVVDDSVTTRTLEKSILEAEGYRVRLSVDGADALAQLRAEPVDVVVSDIEMPRVDGFELLRAMKEDATLAEIPVILVTSREDRADRERGLRLGADAYVVKQKFDQVELLKTIRQVI